MIQNILRTIIHGKRDKELENIKQEARDNREKKVQQIEQTTKEIEKVVAYQLGKATGGFRYDH